MAEKLKKVEKDYYTLYDSDSDIVASNNPKTPTTKKLSLKNCQAIENGYDLDELAEKHYDVHIKRGHTKEDSLQRKIDFILGFQKAIEILGEKKFSEDDMIAASKYGYNFRATTSFPEQEFEDSCIRNTQQWLRYYSTLPKQTEWEVEIVMETCSMNPYDLDCSEIVERPKLDADGCLILKRK